MAKPYTLILRTGKRTIEIPLLTYHLANESTVIDCPVTDADLLRAIMAHYPALKALFDRGLASMENEAAKVQDDYKSVQIWLTAQGQYAADLKNQMDRLEELRSMQKLIEEGQ